MKPVFKFFAFLLILGLVGQLAKYQADRYEPEEFAVSDVRTVTEDRDAEVVIRLSLGDCPLLTSVAVSQLDTVKSKISLALRIVLG